MGKGVEVGRGGGAWWTLGVLRVLGGGESGTQTTTREQVAATRWFDVKQRWL